MTSSKADSIRGRIIRKRKHHSGVGYAIKPLLEYENNNCRGNDEKREEEAQASHTTNDPTIYNTTTTTSSSSSSSSSSNGSSENEVTLVVPQLQEQQQQQQVTNNPPPILVLVPRDDPCIAWCFVGAVVHVDFDNDSLLQEEEKKDDGMEDGTMPPKNSYDGNNNNNNNNNNNKKANAQSKRKHLRSAKRVELLQCSPDPNAIVACLEMVMKGILSLDAFPSAFLPGLDQVQELLAASPKDEDRRKRILDISRDLQIIGPTTTSHYQYHHPDAKNYGTSKTGKPRIKRRYWYVLEQMEKTVTLMVPRQQEALAVANGGGWSPNLNVQALNTHLATEEIPAEELGFSSPTMLACSENEAMVWNVPDINSMSNKHSISRVEYLKVKKWPQIHWLLQKLQHILDHKTAAAAAAEPNNKELPAFFRLLDVGGGRGDLAVAMVQSFANVHVTVVDVNETSLQAGKAFAEQLMGKKQASDRIHFQCADIATFVQNELSPMETSNQFDVVVAWHACGDLSDYALEFSIRTNTSFIICPCCYTKRHIRGFEPKWIADYVSAKNFANFCQVIPMPPPDLDIPMTSSHATKPFTESLETDLLAVQRMAEINEHIEVSRRAMLLINSMRMVSLGRHQEQERKTKQPQNQVDDTMALDDGVMVHGGLKLSLEEYDIKHSSKNLVLVGMHH